MLKKGKQLRGELVGDDDEDDDGFINEPAQVTYEAEGPIVVEEADADDEDDEETADENIDTGKDIGCANDDDDDGSCFIPITVSTPSNGVVIREQGTRGEALRN
ncbi:hypothetical protein L6452_09438 [Arctium lappa]|uniref:Uncharacterized protein n=1 Tax=Arctium lappa TaxID=4217 RepID=A0ACB9DL73_ARCLA|nr:hypothetical protein L6452_09438 [Arctium lappa]